MNNNSIIQNPGTLSTVNSIYGSTFVLSNADYSTNNFRYLAKLYINNVYQYNASFPPRPTTGYGLFSPASAVESNLSIDLQPTITSVATASNGIKSYKIQEGFECNPGLTISNTFVTPGSTSSISLTFSTPHGLAVGDVITILKDDMAINPQLNGTSSVVALRGTYSVDIDKKFTSFSLTNETGRIIDMVRYGTFSSTFYGFRGVRQYEDVSTDYYNNYTIGVSGGQSLFLTNFPRTVSKLIRANEYETLSFISNRNLTKLEISTYDSSYTLLNTYSFTQSTSTSITRYDIPSGTANLSSMGVSFTNVKYYTISLKVGSILWSEVFEYEIDDSCTIYTPVRIMFVNKLGGIDYFTFTQDDKKEMSSTRTYYKKQLNWNYSIGDRERTVSSVQSDESHTLNSNWLSEDVYQWLSELITTIDAYKLYNGSCYPINIDDTSFTYKTAYRDQIFNLQMRYTNSSKVLSQKQ